MLVVLFFKNDCLSRAAAISFYITVFFVPVLILIVSLVGLVLGETAARSAIIDQSKDFIGADAAALIGKAISHTYTPESGILATAISLIVMVFSAGGIFAELQTALDSIFGTNDVGELRYQLIRSRLSSFILVVIICFLLVIILTLDFGAHIAFAASGIHLPYGGKIALLASSVFSFLCTGLLIGTIYRVLPTTLLPVRTILFAAVATALLFQINRFGFGAYFSSEWMLTLPGAAGALIAILMWCYFSALIFLIGALVAKVFSTSYIKGN